MADRSDRDNWAGYVERLEDGGVNLTGRRLNGPLQGFGPMLQKTYRTRIPGKTPEEVIAEWKDNFGSFWPRHSKFNAPLAGIAPGEVGSISSMQMLSTGVMILYADETSFAYMTPEGHPFSGFITFSAIDDGGTVAQIQLLIRPSDPIWDAVFLFGFDRGEDAMWQHTLRSLAAHFGHAGDVSTEVVKVDPKRQWKNWSNVWRNAMWGSAGHILSWPVRVFRKG
jgi:hypothetical protein